MSQGNTILAEALVGQGIFTYICYNLTNFSYFLFIFIYTLYQILGIKYCCGIVGIPVIELGFSLQGAGMNYYGFRNEQAAAYAAGVIGYMTNTPGSYTLLYKYIYFFRYFAIFLKIQFYYVFSDFCDFHNFIISLI